MNAMRIKLTKTQEQMLRDLVRNPANGFAPFGKAKRVADILRSHRLAEWPATGLRATESGIAWVREQDEQENG